MPTTQPVDSVAHPDMSKPELSAAGPATAKKATLGATRTTAKRVAADSKMPTPVGKSGAKAALARAARPASSKLLKPKKIILVRDSFTIPKLEYLMLDALKLRAEALGKSVKKSTLIRAGIKALAAMPDSQFLAAVKAITRIKTGHPTKD